MEIRSAAALSRRPGRWRDGGQRRRGHRRDLRNLRQRRGRRQRRARAHLAPRPTAADPDLRRQGGWNTPAGPNGRGQVVGTCDIPGDVVDGVLNSGFLCHTASSGGGDRDAENSAAAGRHKHHCVRHQRCGPGRRSTLRWTGRDRARSSGRTAGPTISTPWVPPGSPLYLVYAEGINNRGEITGQGCVLVDGARLSNDRRGNACILGRTGCSLGAGGRAGMR